jgi:simple sugar transport system ATP-binding protein
MMNSPLWENRILGHQRGKPVMRGFIVDKQATIASTQTIMEEFDVRAPGPQTLAAALSGGNQQKFIVGREMSKAPALLLASHPTRGVDVGAQAAIWDVLRQARETGMAIVLISADLEELIGLRCEKPILHPVTGQTLVEVGQLITRSMVRQLETTDFRTRDQVAQTKRV